MNGSLSVPGSPWGARVQGLLLTTTALAVLALGPGCGLEEGGLGANGAPPSLARDAATRPPLAPPAPPGSGSIDPPPGAGPGAIDPPPAPPPEAFPDAAPPPDAGAAPDAGAPDGAADSAAPDPGEPPPAPPSAPPPSTPGDFCEGGPGLLLCLTFDGDVEDRSQARRDVRAEGVTFEPGRRGQAGRFGPGREVEVRESFGLFERVLSVEAAVRPSELPPQGRRAGIVHSSNQYGLFLLGPQGDVECRTPAGQAVARRAAGTGAWTLVRCVFDRNGVEVFIDGDLAAQGALDAPIQARMDQPIVIGTTDFEGGPFLGLIDEVRLWRGRRER